MSLLLQDSETGQLIRFWWFGEIFRLEEVVLLLNASVDTQ